jgi:hypothetical protein
MGYGEAGSGFCLASGSCLDHLLDAGPYPVDECLSLYPWLDASPPDNGRHVDARGGLEMMIFL